MKKLKSTVVVLVLGGVVSFFAIVKQGVAGQSEYYSRGTEGVLRMKHSPALGINIPISIWIDGIQAGGFAKGHVYERYLTPGRHDVYARRPGHIYRAGYGRLDVRPGETYSFVVKSTPYRVVLKPVSRIE